jgi:hypothetical protein
MASIMEGDNSFSAVSCWSDKSLLFYQANWTREPQIPATAHSRPLNILENE